VGSTKGRDLPIPGRELGGIHFAMHFLPQQNRVVAGDTVKEQILATGRHVVILGGGDTGSDCLGTSLRQGAASVTQIELLPRPPEERTEDMPWPHWPMILRTSSSQEEGGERQFALLTKRFLGDASGRVRALEVVEVEWVIDGGRRVMREREGTLREIPCDLVLLAMGFVGPEEASWSGTALAKDERGNVKADLTSFASNERGVFACGDARRGQSLVVWAIWEGRECARAVDAYLLGESRLPQSPYLDAPLPL
jgi:glutamate synthase (NADPH) small chain